MDARWVWNPDRSLISPSAAPRAEGGQILQASLCQRSSVCEDDCTYLSWRPLVAGRRGWRHPVRLGCSTFLIVSSLILHCDLHFRNSLLRTYLHDHASMVKNSRSSDYLPLLNQHVCNKSHTLRSSFSPFRKDGCTTDLVPASLWSRCPLKPPHDALGSALQKCVGGRNLYGLYHFSFWNHCHHISLTFRRK